MLEKTLPSLPHINPGKIVKTPSKYRNPKYQKRELGIALPEGNSEDNSDSSLLIKLLRRVGN